MSDDQQPKPRPKRPSIPPFAIITSTYWDHPKIVEAGFDAAVLHIFALTTIAETGRTGFIPAGRLQPRYVARRLGIDEQRAANAFSECVRVGLFEVQDGADEVHVPAFDDKYHRTDSTDYERERKRKWRADAAAKAGKRARLDGDEISTDASGSDPDPKEEDLDVRGRDRAVPDKSGTVPDISLPGLELRLDRISVRRGRGHITWTAKARGELAALSKMHGEDVVASRWDNLLCRPDGYPETRTIGVFCQPNIFDLCAERKVDLVQRCRDEDEALALKLKTDVPQFIPRDFVKLEKSKVREVYAVLTERNEWGLFPSGEPTVDHYQRWDDGVFARIETERYRVAGPAPVYKIEWKRSGTCSTDFLTTVFQLPDESYVLVDVDDVDCIAELYAKHYPERAEVPASLPAGDPDDDAPTSDVMRAWARETKAGIR